MTPVLPALVNALVDERLREAEMRYVGRASEPRSNRFAGLKARLLERQSDSHRRPAERGNR